MAYLYNGKLIADATYTGQVLVFSAIARSQAKPRTLMTAGLFTARYALDSGVPEFRPSGQAGVTAPISLGCYLRCYLGCYQSQNSEIHVGSTRKVL